MTAPRDLPAGEFSAWLAAMRLALAGDCDTDVPCGDCSAPVSGSGQPKGTVLMGYDEHGRCCMLRDGRCTIYEDRPLTCRTYDCRVFAAAGVPAPEQVIARRARR